MRNRSIWIIVPALFGACMLSAEAGIHGGRALDEGKTFSAGINYGSIQSIEGTVTETKRAGASGVTTEGRFLESYDFSEFGYDSTFDSYGLYLEKNWKFFSMLLDLNYFKAEGSAVARRLYAIGVDSVMFNGRSYEYMIIEDGEAFSSEIEATIIDFKLQFSPFHIEGHNTLTFSPWLMLGLYALTGDFSVDAGPAKGVRTYEIDPFPYVIGGYGEGSVEAVAPEYGFGAELKFPLFHMNGDVAELAIQGNYLMLEFAGSSGDFGVSSRNEKNVDLTFVNYELRGMLELPLGEGADVFVGLAYKHIDAEAEIEAFKRPPGQSTTEKYDKDARLAIEAVYAMFGFNF